MEEYAVKVTSEHGLSPKEHNSMLNHAVYMSSLSSLSKIDRAHFYQALSYHSASKGSSIEPAFWSPYMSKPNSVVDNFLQNCLSCFLVFKSRSVAPKYKEHLTQYVCSLINVTKNLQSKKKALTSKWYLNLGSFKLETDYVDVQKSAGYIVPIALATENSDSLGLIIDIKKTPTSDQGKPEKKTHPNQGWTILRKKTLEALGWTVLEIDYDLWIQKKGPRFVENTFHTVDMKRAGPMIDVELLMLLHTHLERVEHTSTVKSSSRHLQSVLED
jgi:hypothetical protein